jgi:predicted nucleotidyltransferase
VDQDDRLLKDLARFRRRLDEHLPGGVEHFTLFGSRATGRAHPESDVDVLVVSSGFEGQNFLQRARAVRREWSLPQPIDVLCYTPAEFARLRAEVSIVSVALAEGVAV